MLLILMLKIGTRGIREIEMDLGEMVVTRNLKMENLERMGKSVSPF